MLRLIQRGYLGQCWRHGLLDFTECLCFFVSLFKTPTQNPFSIDFLCRQVRTSLICGLLHSCQHCKANPAYIEPSLHVHFQYIAGALLFDLATFACKRKPLTVYFTLYFGRERSHWAFKLVTYTKLMTYTKRPIIVNIHLCLSMIFIRLGLSVHTVKCHDYLRAQ